MTQLKPNYLPWVQFLIDHKLMLILFLSIVFVAVPMSIVINFRRMCQQIYIDIKTTYDEYKYIKDDLYVREEYPYYDDKA